MDMTLAFAKGMVWRCVRPVAAIVLVMTANGCVTAAMMGVKVVGTAAHGADVDARTKELLGQPVSAADTAFGKRMNTFEETRSGRAMMTYPVKGDVLDQYRWVVEVENGKIMALAKLQKDPDGGSSIIKKAMLKGKVIDKTPSQIHEDSHFEKLMLVLRNRATGNLVRVYDVRGMTDLLGARYCVLGFDRSDRCTEIRLVGVPASQGEGAINP